MLRDQHLAPKLTCHNTFQIARWFLEIANNRLLLLVELVYGPLLPGGNFPMPEIRSAEMMLRQCLGLTLLPPRLPIFGKR